MRRLRCVAGTQANVRQLLPFVDRCTRYDSTGPPTSRIGGCHDSIATPLPA